MTVAPNVSTYQAMASRALATDRYGSAADRGGVDATVGCVVPEIGDYNIVAKSAAVGVVRVTPEEEAVHKPVLANQDVPL